MRNYVKNDKGLTLVEVLASTVLITLLLVTFMMMFAQASKSNVASETIIDSTYIAQSEMEQVYALSKKNVPVDKVTALSSKYGSSVSKTISGTKWQEYSKIDDTSGNTIKIRLEDTPAAMKMTRIVIEVYEGTKTNPSAKMENVLIWEVVSP
ncbi:hypothetical protein [Planomicrobium sp. YIM 101495]|uniref:type IV pilus modification PilV family protein n=1 Tax=Planomicrobium sp. YIM 101495 TaxID=2665160 RepID=UPI0012BA2405|nr:hypothetical protein [Planomicrobium sp. YIM 101495]MTD29615.1 hypothetical protein [Planomicrobium sp. YIM 101495]